MKLKLLSLSLLILCFWHCVQQTQSEGARLYQAQCVNCHMEDGSGLRGLIPPLTDSEFLTVNRDNLPCWIKHGMSGPVIIHGKEYEGEMPGVPTLTDTEIANILNFMRDSWHPDISFYSENEVKSALKGCE